MRRVSFGTQGARRSSDERLQNVAIAPLTESAAKSGASFQVVCFHLGAGARIARHPARSRQLLAVVDGSGWVSGADGHPQPIAAGEAVVWDEGEDHETASDDGMTAIVIESPDLYPLSGR
jgi:quercetin dioxygenase-like cupin family protein